MTRTPVRSSTRAGIPPVVVRLEGTNQQLANLCGPFDAHLRLIELRLGV